MSSVRINIKMCEEEIKEDEEERRGNDGEWKKAKVMRERKKKRGTNWVEKISTYV